MPEAPAEQRTESLDVEIIREKKKKKKKKKKDQIKFRASCHQYSTKATLRSADSSAR